MSYTKEEIEALGGMNVAELRQAARQAKEQGKAFADVTGSQISAMPRDQLLAVFNGTALPGGFINKPSANDQPGQSGGIAAAVAALQAAIEQEESKSGIDPDAVREIVEQTTEPMLDRLTAIETCTGAIESLVDAIKADASVAARVPVVSAASSGNPVLAKLVPLYKPGVETGTNALILSPPSFGKSWACRELGKAYDQYLEHGCSNDMDEIATLLGNPMPDGAGGFQVVDGVLTQAVRAASTGSNVMLLLDEALRLPETVQEWLLTFLTGVKTPDGLIYRLRTRKMVADANGDRVQEVIECKAANLHIIAAANLGPVNPIEAFWSRFKKVRIEWNLDMASDIALAIAGSYGVDRGEAALLATRFADAMKAGREKTASGQLQFPPDFRMLERGCKHAAEPTAESIGAWIASGLADDLACWHPDTGDILPDSKTAAESIAAIIKG